MAELAPWFQVNLALADPADCFNDDFFVVAGDLVAVKVGTDILVHSLTTGSLVGTYPAQNVFDGYAVSDRAAVAICDHELVEMDLLTGRIDRQISTGVWRLFGPFSFHVCDGVIAVRHQGSCTLMDYKTGALLRRIKWGKPSGICFYCCGVTLLPGGNDVVCAVYEDWTNNETHLVRSDGGEIDTPLRTNANSWCWDVHGAVFSCKHRGDWSCVLYTGDAGGVRYIYDGLVKGVRTLAGGGFSVLLQDDAGQIRVIVYGDWSVLRRAWILAAVFRRRALAAEAKQLFSQFMSR